MDAPILVPTVCEASIASLLTSPNRQDEERHLRSSYPALREVSRDGHDELIHLRGLFPTQYLRQITQAVVSLVECERLIINHIEVIAPTGGNSIGYRHRRATIMGGRPY
ncbi:MAG: hypothetical protein JOZ53_18695 [Planctomycetaceae bacterium]|nr:hypothetical protein [Planctomycetaceae bacterium]